MRPRRGLRKQQLELNLDILAGSDIELYSRDEHVV